MLEANPWTAYYTLCCVIILESNLHAIHRKIMKDNIINHREQTENQKLPIPNKNFPQ